MEFNYESDILTGQELGSIVVEVKNKIYFEESQRAMILLADGSNLANSPEAVESYIRSSTIRKIEIAEYAKVNNLTFEEADKILFPRKPLLTPKRKFNK